jgi:hypothetical protein
MSNYELSDIDKGIIKLWEQGFSGSHIAKELYVTRNVVMGRIHRMRKGGINLGSRMVAPTTLIPPKKKNYRKPYPAPKPEPEEAPRTQGVRFMDLQFGDCKYVMNDGPPANYIFCGLPADNGAYCKDHHRICYMPPESKRHRTTNGRFKVFKTGNSFHDDSA